MKILDPHAESSRLKSSETLPDRVYAMLLQGILGGEFPANGKLPPENQLARRFEVSRPTVRQAISRLRSDGVVASRRGAGTFVVRMPASNDSKRNVIESIADVHRYYSFRMCVEAGAAAEAAEMRNDSDLGKIRVALSELSGAIEDGAPGVEQDVKFHLSVARASHNQFFVTAIEESVEPIRKCIELARSLSAGKSAQQNQRLHLEHQRIVDAIAAQSSADAAEAMRSHIAHARNRIFVGPAASTLDDAA
jgi:GntR family transcriptional repressor for pyruvate dehydrogenase complex